MDDCFDEPIEDWGFDEEEAELIEEIKQNNYNDGEF